MVIAYVTYRSRKHRDSVMKKALADERMQKMSEAAVPFDARRMIFGGFRTIVEL